MSLLAIGLNHQSAPVDVRERVVLPAEQLQDTLNSLYSHTSVREAVILCTCNRTELYCAAEDDAVNAVIDWLHIYLQQPTGKFAPYLFHHRNRLAVRHLLRVCSGMDSLVLGEPQILGQVKDAFAKANEFGGLGPRLRHLFQNAFNVAKAVRTNTAIGANPISVAYAAVQLAGQVFENLSEKTVLLIGAGETSSLVARHLQAQGMQRFLVANRSLDNAQVLADSLNGQALPLAQIGDVLAQADIVVSSTAATLPILGKGAVERALRARKHRPVLLLDLAVPRDIEPEVADLEDAFLYSVDDLSNIVASNRASRAEAASEAELIITEKTEQYMAWLRAAPARDLLKSLHHQAAQLQHEVLERAHKRLSQGHDPDAVLQQLAHQLTQKLLHAPSLSLREAGARGDDAALHHARHLYGLDLSQP